MLRNDKIKEIREKNNYGYNVITPPPETPWWKLYLEKFEDPIIVILLVATGISLLFGFINGDFTESLGIIFAILIATGVGFWQEYSAKKKFDAMKSSRDYDLVRVKRGSDEYHFDYLEVPRKCLLPGDIVLLSAGDEVPADIKLTESTNLLVSEACMTGESVPAEKYVMTEEYTGSGFSPGMIYRGTTISSGFCEGEVVAIGDNTMIGKTTQDALKEIRTKTPLEIKLDELADKITIAAFIIAGLMFVILNITHWMHNPFEWSFDMIMTEIKFLMAAVVVIIVAVPEGLPLAVTLSLAFSMKTMAKEKNLVKKMHACETIGATNIIFTDKTGTLTKNQMEVVNISSIREDKMKVVGVMCNTAVWSVEREIYHQGPRETLLLGSPTECAILRHIGEEDYYDIKEEWKTLDTIPFCSENKYMVSFIYNSNSEESWAVIKGAPEVISRIIDESDYMDLVEIEQESGRRALSAAILGKVENSVEIDEMKKRLLNGEVIEGSEYLGTWFIEDPVRSDVPEAIEQCYGAGIDVVMVTGDNIKTAAEIARQAGIDDIWAIEAKEFDKAVKEGDWTRDYPNVISRCTPEDKLKILSWAQSKGYVCAMTGDGRICPIL